MKSKNMIFDALKEENLKLKNKIKKLEEQLLEVDQKSNHLDQYNGRNNLEIQVIPVNVTDDELEGKVIDIVSCLGIEVKGADVEDCHRLGYANPKNTIDRFVHGFYSPLNGGGIFLLGNILKRGLIFYEGFMGG